MRSPLVALVVGGAYLSLVFGGCVSNEYVIPKTELSRLANLPPSQRGSRVHVVQELGSRQDWAADNGDAVTKQAYETEFAGYDHSGDTVDAALNVAATMPPMGGSARPFVPLSGTRSSGPRTWTPTGAPPRPQAGASSSGGGNLNLGNIGGGGGGGDDLAIFAIVLVAVAVMAA